MYFVNSYFIGVNHDALDEAGIVYFMIFNKSKNKMKINKLNI